MTLLAFRLADGSIAWEYENDGTALEASGGVMIGLADAGVIRVVAPGEHDLRVDRATGALVSFDEPPHDRDVELTRFPAPRPTAFVIETALSGYVARSPKGAAAWTLSVEDPFVDPLPPVESDDGAIVLVTASQHVPVLDVVRPAP